MMDEKQAVTPSDASAPRKVTFEEFLELDEPLWAEWVDGEIIDMGMVDIDHDDYSNFFLTLFRHHAEQRGGRALSEPFVIKLGPTLSGRSPDACYLRKENLDRLVERKYLRGPADLVVEVVSPGSRRRDTVEKRAEYALAGVREYWIVDPERSRVEFLVLDESGRYEAADLSSGVFHSSVLEGAWIRVEWLFGERLPRLLDVLRDWGLV